MAILETLDIDGNKILINPKYIEYVTKPEYPYEDKFGCCLHMLHANKIHIIESLENICDMLQQI